MRQFGWILAIAGSLGAVAASAAGQQPTNVLHAIGTVATQDADVTGAASVTSGRAEIAGSGTVTAKDHAAELTLARGGMVRVCATSGLHVASGAAAPSTAIGTASAAGGAGGVRPLMLALDRGAMEIHTEASTSDVVMTPDLRLSVKSGGPLDLRMRVTPNGDTCIENRPGRDASKTPALEVSSLFGDATYEVKAGQHLLFEHGDLHEVVDDESSPCGCPEDATSPAATGGVFGPGTKPATQQGRDQQAANEHPFPAAVSEGLAPPPPVPQAAPGVAHAQVATTLSYSNGDAAPAVNAEPPMLGEGVPHAETRVEKPGVFRRIGRFFKRIL